MAGSFASKVILTQEVVAGLAAAKLDIAIQVDCSHAKNFVTWPQNDQAKNVMAKDIEVDAALSFQFDGTPAFARTALKLSPFKALSSLCEEIEGYRDNNGRSGFDTIPFANLKIEFPSLDPKLVDLKNQALSGIVGACRSATTAAFNARPAHLRQCMGMYARVVGVRGAVQYTAPAADPQPRMA